MRCTEKQHVSQWSLPTDLAHTATIPPPHTHTHTPSGPNTFHDSVCGKPLFRAPLGRDFKTWHAESIAHGWPSFRDEEIVKENIKVRNLCSSNLLAMLCAVLRTISCDFGALNSTYCLPPCRRKTTPCHVRRGKADQCILGQCISLGVCL